jgi:hypothetical protein
MRRLFRRLSARLLLLAYILVLIPIAPSALALPRIFWASDPIRPNETVMLSGSDMGAAAVVDMTRLGNSQGKNPSPEDTAHRGATSAPSIVAHRRSRPCHFKNATLASW